MLHLAKEDDAAEQINQAHLGAVLEGLAQAEAGTFASGTEVEAAFRRFGA